MTANEPLYYQRTSNLHITRINEKKNNEDHKEPNQLLGKLMRSNAKQTLTVA